MAYVNQKRKKDLRVIYTRRVLKEALLKQMSCQQFQNISITALCEEASVSRSTFYAHYENTRELLNEVIHDFMSQVTFSLNDIRKNFTECRTHPLCDLIRTQDEYLCLFRDETSLNLMIDQLVTSSLPLNLPQMRENGWTDVQAEVLLRFQINGCISAAVQYRTLPDPEWNEIKRAIHTNIRFLGRI